MSQIICSKCMKVHQSDTDKCPECGLEPPYTYNFRNSDEYLKKEAPKVLKERKEAGLQGLVKGLEYIIINTEPNRQKKAVLELLEYTGLECTNVFEDESFYTAVLKGNKKQTQQNSPDILVQSRKNGNPFIEYNVAPKTKHVPNTRVETFVFETPNIEKYVAIQKSRGVTFLSDPVHTENFSFVQTIPSSYTGNSLGFIEWNNKGEYTSETSEILDWNFKKPDKDYLQNIYELDHTAARVKAKNRDAAIIEFLELTNYHFDFAIYVKVFNSITNVARLSDEDFAMVFTSGISPYISDEESGPTEKFIHNYNVRVHHMAFHTEKIEEIVASIKEDGMDFLIELVGSPDQGLKQCFTKPSENTLLVNEYIHRYGGFDGFFTRSNVTKLTAATEKQ
jgi:4-hydroxyphenylpyruvate dioxygenase-like putative hemolysin